MSIDAVEQIVSDAERAGVFLRNLAKGKHKTQEQVFTECLKDGVVNGLRGVFGEELSTRKESLAQKLSAEKGRDLELYREAIDVLCIILFGSEPGIPVEEYASVAETDDAGRKDGDIININIEMVFVEGGTFTMGGTSEQGSDCRDEEKPPRSVTLSDYYIGKYEVTQGLWKSVMGSLPPTLTPSSMYGYGDDYPVYNVSWNDAVNEFLPRLNQLTGKQYRLPTEAEWEYAARGGANGRGYKYSGGDDIESVALYNKNGGHRTHPVGGKSPNELGIYDMSGNVEEWVSDWYAGYPLTAQTDPTGPASGCARVFRGGGWGRSAGGCRVSCRSAYSYHTRSYYVGFRLALSPI